MKPMTTFISLCTLIFTYGCVSFNSPTVKLDTLPLEQLSLPDGFEIEVYVSDIKGARSMARGDDGTIYVGTRGKEVYAVPDANGDLKGDRVITLREDMNLPNGIAFRDGDLYVAEVNQVWKFEGIGSKLDNVPTPVKIGEEFPSDKWHGWKYIAFGPDGKLYVPVGAPCNICDRDADGYSSIFRMNPDGTNREVFAHGVRNTVGFDWHPETNALWFTDNGRDMMGDDVPNDELNHAPEAGMHFGYPFCHAGSIADPKFGAERSCNEFTPPAQKLGPHVAALGVHFYRGAMFPDTYKKGVFIAEHGSWNRTQPIGYRLSFVELDGNKAVNYKTLIDGWLGDSGAWGRPVDLLELPDGSILLSDDQADAIYRISYVGD